MGRTMRAGTSLRIGRRRRKRTPERRNGSSGSSMRASRTLEVAGGGNPMVGRERRMVERARRMEVRRMVTRIMRRTAIRDPRDQVHLPDMTHCSPDLSVHHKMHSSDEHDGKRVFTTCFRMCIVAQRTKLRSPLRALLQTAATLEWRRRSVL